jgi:hypothetical protein
MTKNKSLTAISLRSFIIFVAAFFAVIVMLPGISSAINPEPGDLTFPLQDFVIVTEEDMDIPGDFAIGSGHICSRTGDMFLGGTNHIVRIPQNSPIDAADPAECPYNVIVATGTATCGKNALLGDVRGTLNKISGCRTCNENPAPLICPDDPPFPVFSASNDPLFDIVCTRFGTDIVPGTYRDLIVEKNGVCNFRGAGEYNFRRIQAGTRSRYAINFVDNPPVCDKFSPYIVNVKEYVVFAEDGKVNSSNVSPVYFNVEGIDASYGGTNICPLGLDPGNPPSVFCYRGDGTLNMCRVHAPNGTVALRGHLNSTLQVLSKHFKDVRGLTVKLSLPDPDCCFNTPDCACITSFSNSTDPFKGQTAAPGEDVIIRGKDFNRTTVDKVIFVSTGSPAIDVANPVGNPLCDVTVDNIAPDSIVDDTTIEITVPAGCPADDYYLGIVNGTVCVKRDLILTVTP